MLFEKENSFLLEKNVHAQQKKLLKSFYPQKISVINSAPKQCPTNRQMLFYVTRNVPALTLSWRTTYIYIYTGCNRRNGPDFGRVFLRSNYTDITQNTYIQSWTVTEILAREKCGFLWCLRTVLVGDVILPLLELNFYVIVICSASDLDNGQASKSV